MEVLVVVLVVAADGGVSVSEGRALIQLPIAFGGDSGPEGVASSVGVRE